MLKKGFKDLLAEANAVIESMDVTSAAALVGDGDTVFVDVREMHERQTGFIPGSVHAPRGFLEFIADPAGPMHEPALGEDKRIVLYRGSGARSALAAKTLKDMGFARVVSLVGGMAAWKAADRDIAF
ncbi:MAG: rhodanese-like domain-containing protein [Kiloniellaceae bacterium]